MTIWCKAISGFEPSKRNGRGFTTNSAGVTKRRSQVDIFLVVEERRRQVSLRAARYQQALRRYHYRNIRPRMLEVGNLVLRRVLSREGLHKLSPMWEGPSGLPVSPGLAPRAWRHWMGSPSRTPGTSSTFGSSNPEARPVPVKKAQCL